jgi:ferredoxin-NADP reductase
MGIGGEPESWCRCGRRHRKDWSLAAARLWVVGRESLASWPPDALPLIYICGPSGFVEASAHALVDSGHDPERIKTERSGRTGD